MDTSQRNYLRLLLAPIFLLLALTIYAQPDCTNDTVAPLAVCDDSITVIAHPVNGYIVTPDALNGGSWDDCTTINNLDFRVELSSDYTGTPPATTTVTLPPVLNAEDAVLWVGDEAGNWSACWNTIVVEQISSVVEGQLFTDSNANCMLDAGEENSGMESWTVQATSLTTGNTYTASTDPNGNFLIYVEDLEPGEAGDILVELILPFGIIPSCSSISTLSNTPTGVNEHNFPITLVDDCSLLSVDIGTPFLRRCFTNTYYVNYCNYSSFQVDDAIVTVEFDTQLEVIDATVPIFDLGNNVYSFDIGDVPPAYCGSFQITVGVDCDIELGRSLCVTATIEPSDCKEPGPNWSGASLQVSGDCDEENQEVIFKVKNTGTGNVNESLKFQVVEDVVMYMNGSLNDLPAGDSTLFSYPANGSTWHFLVAQATDHPGMSMPIAFVEGCNGFTLGMVNQFSFNDADPDISIDCTPVIGSYDPNDKQAFPRGYDEEHFISQNEPIEYMIRFQNTGTDTAFNVVLEDQLSEWLDPSTLRTGASSHTYHAELSEEGLLKFYFDDIMLPDSNVNEPASHGFVKFWIQQQPDNAIGTIIENTASIYFDFNDAIITNTVMHTVGEAFVLTNTNREYTLPGLTLTVHPNPFSQTAYFNLGGYEVQTGHFQLLDAQGRIVKQRSFQGNGFEFHRHNLSSGLYYYRITEGGAQLVSGKIVVR